MQESLLEGLPETKVERRKEPEKPLDWKAKTCDEKIVIDDYGTRATRPSVTICSSKKTVVEKRGEKMDKSKIYHFTGIKGSE